MISMSWHGDGFGSMCSIQDAQTVGSYEPKDGVVVHCLNNPSGTQVCREVNAISCFERRGLASISQEVGIMRQSKCLVAWISTEGTILTHEGWRAPVSLTWIM